MSKEKCPHCGLVHDDDDGGETMLVGIVSSSRHLTNLFEWLIAMRAQGIDRQVILTDTIGVLNKFVLANPRGLTAMELESFYVQERSQIEKMISTVYNMPWPGDKEVINVARQTAHQNGPAGA